MRPPLAQSHTRGAARGGYPFSVQPPGSGCRFDPGRARRGGHHTHGQRQNPDLQPACSGALSSGSGRPGAVFVPAQGPGPGPAGRLRTTDRPLAAGRPSPRRPVRRRHQRSLPTQGTRRSAHGAHHQPGNVAPGHSAPPRAMDHLSGFFGLCGAGRGPYLPGRAGSPYGPIAAPAGPGVSALQRPARPCSVHGHRGQSRGIGAQPAGRAR